MRKAPADVRKVVRPDKLQVAVVLDRLVILVRRGEETAVQLRDALDEHVAIGPVHALRNLLGHSACGRVEHPHEGARAPGVVTAGLDEAAVRCELQPLRPWPVRVRHRPQQLHGVVPRPRRHHRRGGPGGGLPRRRRRRRSRRGRRGDLRGDGCDVVFLLQSHLRRIRLLQRERLLVGVVLPPAVGLQLGGGGARLLTRAPHDFDGRLVDAANRGQDCQQKGKGKRPMPDPRKHFRQVYARRKSRHRVKHGI
mmetsp:Transcript_72475/g.207921  ORF Transcript_72475/g.207921 Transcript_72475/m.207921 type:complete len:252 (+) Transcript_72475:633-1388(+)